MRDYDDYDDYDREDTVLQSVAVPRGGEILFVLGRIGDSLWCAGSDTKSETIRHLRAALKRLGEEE